ncbi:MAG: tRNA epoxyqueuosine(34) reductase QueG [Planctomycetota bacterium]
MKPSPRIVRELALEAGFDLVAIGPAAPGDGGGRFLSWVEAGRHGEMDWLARNAERIASAGGFLTGARSAVTLGVDYGRPQVALDGGGQVARYAAGRDYHRALGARLRRLKGALVQEGVEAGDLRYGVDAVPVLERALAARAGLGFLAKTGGVIHPRRGPWLLLAEVLTRHDLEADPPSPGSCGTCRRCLEACPTDAITAPFEVDARRCLSYTTIELRGPIPAALRAPQGDWVFGCDVCLEVCPYAKWGRGRPEDPDLALHPTVERYELVGLLELDEEAWQRDFTGTAIRRARREGLRRNAAIALGNLGREDAVPALLRAVDDRDPGLVSAAAWALARLGRGREAIADALRRTDDEALRADLEATLAGLG